MEYLRRLLFVSFIIMVGFFFGYSYGQGTLCCLQGNKYVLFIQYNRFFFWRDVIKIKNMVGKGIRFSLWVTFCVVR
jgi:hypothetical protein